MKVRSNNSSARLAALPVSLVGARALILNELDCETTDGGQQKHVDETAFMQQKLFD